MDAFRFRRTMGVVLGLSLGVGAAVSASSCLPGDSRPPPAIVQVSVEPGAALRDGLTTADGWDIQFDRVLLGIGGTAITGEACTSYASARYDRLLLGAAPDKQKVSELYGLGTCGFRFRLRTPSNNALLGEGVGEEDLTFMRNLDSDPVVTVGGTSVYVQGKAVKGAITRRFAWHFRRAYSFHNCGAGDGGVFPEASAPDDEDLVHVNLVSGAAVALTIEIHPEELFRTGPALSAPMGFDSLASVGEGETVVLDDLDQLPAPEGFEPVVLDGGDAGPPTLVDFVYATLLPRILQLEGKGLCQGDPRSTNF